MVAQLGLLAGEVGGLDQRPFLQRQILGLLPNRERVARAVTVGCGSGYWRENAAALPACPS